MKTLVWVEHDNSEMKDATLAAVTAASQMGEVHLLVAGSGCSASHFRRLATRYLQYPQSIIAGQIESMDAFLAAPQQSV